jgi:hypothetical protein
MKMEKKTLTSLAMITFLMTSTAVVAMAEDTKSDELTPGSTVQRKGTDKQILSTPPKKSWSFFGLFSWGEPDSSTPEASPASMPSAAPVPHSENSPPTTEDLMRASMSLTHDQLKQVIQAGKSDDPETHRNAEEIINSALKQTVPSSAPVESLPAEQKRTFWGMLLNMFWTTESAAEASTSTGSQPSSSSIDSTPPVKTFRTTGANEMAEIKHSAIYASFPYQNTQDAAYWLIINHRTKDEGPEVRVFNPNARAYINLGRLSPSMGFSDQVFNLSSLFEAADGGSSSTPTMRTELNFIGGVSDIHSFTIKSGEERLMEVILGDQNSEKQTGVHVYAPEVAEKLQEWSEVRSEGVQQ